MIDMKEVTMVIAGIGGYGSTVLKFTLDKLEGWGVKLVGAVDPAWEKAPCWPALEAMGVPHFDSLEEFYKDHKADLAMLCTPIQFHEEHAILAMRNGSDVLCEKPIAATLPQAEHMAQVAQETGRNLHIGFQLSYVPSVLELKRDIMAGVFGAPIAFKTLTCWPRNSDYYARPWCARLKKNGQYVLDSIAMNACAHYMHVLYFLLGSTMETSAQPEWLEGILCRANDIETFDTAALRIRAAGAELDFMATHTCHEKVDPQIVLTFEKAVIKIAETREEDAIHAVFHDGTVKNYGAVRTDFYNKIPYCSDVVRGLKKPICTVETATPHLKTINAITQHIPVVNLPGCKNENQVTVVEGLQECLQEAFAAGKMPWELTDRFGAPTRVELKNYTWEDKL